MTLRQPHQDAVLPAQDAARIREILAACSQLVAWAEKNCGPQFAAAAQEAARPSAWAPQDRRVPRREDLLLLAPGESSIPAVTQDALATLEWISRAENLVIAGPSGTGKSHFAEAVAHAAIEKDLRVAWFSLETLTATIARAKGRRVRRPERRPDLPR